MALSGYVNISGNPQDRVKAMVWDDTKYSLSRPDSDIYYFLTVQDLLSAHQYDYKQPTDVLQAHLEGYTESTHAISLVCVVAGGREWYAGNAAFHSVLRGETPQYFASTSVAATNSMENPGSPNTRARGMIEIPLVNIRPLFGQGPFINAQNVEARSSNPNDPNDITSFMASQAHWTREDPPPCASALEPTAAFPNEEPPPLMYENENHVLGPNNRPLRAFDHILPRHISTRITDDPHILAYWSLSDPRIRRLDIIDRMCHSFSPEVQEELAAVIGQKTREWCENNRVM